ALYGILSVGVHIHLHYCCGKLAGMELVSKQHNCCDDDNNQGCSVTHQCCTYTELNFALEDEHYSSCFQYLITAPVEEIPIPDQVISEPNKEADLTTHFDFAAKRRLFLEHSALLYYA
ncbi:MAG: hypothetical protein ACKVOK_07830, partial [Flavobacteriales bacterium]